jgi:small GTP-binding protein
MKIPVVLWDTAGQERFRTITYGFYKNANGVILVYDVSNRKSFQNIKTWISAINEHASDNVIKVLVGNKVDLPPE